MTTSTSAMETTLESQVSLNTLDYAVAIVIISVPMGIGVLYAVKDAHRVNRTEYLLGGRKMSVVPVALSLFITYQSAISLIGMPAEVYFYGYIFILSSVGLAGSFLFGAAAFVPLMYPLQITSLYEYIKLRYRSEFLRLLSTVVAMLMTTAFMAITLLSPALALQSLANIPLWMSLAVLGAVGTIYTAIGGIKSVIWTDVFQCVVVLVGILIILIRACSDVGGIHEVFRLSQEGGRLDFDELGPDLRTRHTVWGLAIGMFFIWLTNSFNQSSLQRIICMKSLKEARVGYFVIGPMIVVYSIILCTTGLALYAYFSTINCDPYEAGLINNLNQIGPYYVLHAMTDVPGMPGFFVSVLCCGSLSTISSGINALATNTVEDILRRPLQSLQESTITFITKLLVALYGGIIIGLSYLASSLDGPLTEVANSAYAALGSPVVGVFLMGVTVPWANKFGAIAGLVASLVFNIWITVGNLVQNADSRTPLLPSAGIHGCNVQFGDNTAYDYHTNNESNVLDLFNHMNGSYSIKNETLQRTPMQDNDSNGLFFFDISYEWRGLIGIAICTIVGLTVSYISNVVTLRGKQRLSDSPYTTTDARYIFPFLVKFWGLSKMEHLSETTSILNGVSPEKGYVLGEQNSKTK